MIFAPVLGLDGYLDAISMYSISMQTISGGLRFYWSSKPIISAYQAQTVRVQTPEDIRHWKEWLNCTWPEAKMYMIRSGKIQWMDHSAKAHSQWQRFYLKELTTFVTLTSLSRKLIPKSDSTVPEQTCHNVHYVHYFRKQVCIHWMDA